MITVPISPGAIEHLDFLRDSYRSGKKQTPLSRWYQSILAHRFNLLIPPDASVLEIGCGTGELLSKIRAKRRHGLDLSEEQVARAKLRHPALEFSCGSGELGPYPHDQFDYIILSDVLNEAADVELLLKTIKCAAAPNARIIINVYNTLWRPLLSLAGFLGLTERKVEKSWLSRQDVVNIAMLAGWDCFKSFGYILIPFHVPVVSPFVNRWVAPWVPWLCLATILVARKVPAHREPESVSVVIPARNEAGSIAYAMRRVPKLAPVTEIIFVEGHSSDNTWAVIQSLPDHWEHGPIKKIQQTGKGKGNAVIEGFRQASGEIVMILDADLTVPPEDLPKFVDLLASGRADFANGVRLVYPMDEKAMKFANLCANKSFSLIFSWLLGQPVKDTLCGTKALWKSDYDHLDRGRAYFGDFDPFGDFDLLFGADKLNLRITDIPIRYRDRFYGETNINRWRDGVILLRMVLFAARRIKFV